MSAGQSAEARARALRAGARRGLWRRVLAALGMSPSAARADALAARLEHGAKGEKATAKLLKPLASEGWYIRHDLAVPRAKFNLDHLLVSPCGTGLVVPDSKAWRRNWPTTVRGGRVFCGPQDRHDQVEKVAGYAGRVAAALGLPAASVVPVLVIHGSPVAGGVLRARVAGRSEPVPVLGSDLLVPALRALPHSLPNPYAAGALAAHVDRVLVPYVQGR